MRKHRLTISRRIGLGFGLFILVVTIVFLLTNTTLKKSREINRRINEEFAPTLNDLQKLDDQIMRGQDLIRQWAFVRRIDDHQERQELLRLSRSIIPSQLDQINERSSQWEAKDREKIQRINKQVTELLVYYKEVQELLPDFDSYSDPFQKMMAEDYFLEGTKIPFLFLSIQKDLDDVIYTQQQNMAGEIELMNKSFSTLRVLLVYIAIAVIIAGVLIAYFTSRSIVIPINSLKKKLTNLSLGIYSVHPTKAGDDEIGDMAKAVHRLISNFERTKEFSINVGAGNFHIDYEPLSEQDEMGQSLLRMRDDLASYRHEMEQKVYEQTLEIRNQKEVVELQKEQVTTLYTDLQSSIDYAQRLQETILPDDGLISDMFPQSFVFFRPKATVSGDFYWFKTLGGKHIFAAADCTGHGVPGAFMSLVGHNVLNQVTKVYTKPSQILNNVNRMSAEVMRSDESTSFLRDGMDIAMCAFDPKTYLLEYSGAHNPLYLLRQGELTEIAADPFGIGSFTNGEREFTNHEIQLEKGDCIYVFSDGYADQFGGPRNKKMMRKNFRHFLLTIHQLEPLKQKHQLGVHLDSWRGTNEQVDDILIIGVQF
jgi:serine phosphatase RsbU (regulator of sigma subunit)/HAMP domain-containing protein